MQETSRDCVFFLLLYSAFLLGCFSFFHSALSSSLRASSSANPMDRLLQVVQDVMLKG